DEAYWDAINRRRYELIQKKNRGGLSADEFAEFTRLQEDFFAHLDRKFPRRVIDEEELKELEVRLWASIFSRSADWRGPDAKHGVECSDAEMAPRRIDGP